jgi:hypothetical protein
MPTPLFLKGRKKTGGRKKGVRNKRNTILEEAFKQIVTPEIAEGLVLAAVKTFSKGKAGPAAVLLPYCIQEMPKVVEHSGIDDLPVRFTFNFDKFNYHPPQDKTPLPESHNGNGESM